ncbi:DUF6301 family protein [Nocardia asteroides]|uniref:DUF6301 family protein n=1 Tax=Nocardia asteroides TaxID=1824 RepID=UPI00342A2A24
MTNWRAMPAEEAADLAKALHSLDWSWALDDAPAVADKFGWHISSSRPRRIRVDTAFGPDSGAFRAKDSQVTRIDLQLTDFAGPDQLAEVPACFDGISAAITVELGEPTARVAGPPPQLRWAGPKATLVIERSAASVWLYLIINARLADDDRNIELDELGLL